MKYRIEILDGEGSIIGVAYTYAPSPLMALKNAQTLIERDYGTERVCITEVREHANA